MWRYLYFVIGLWVFVPEIRRVYELHAGFSEVSPFSVLPILSLLPFTASVALTGRLRRLPFAFAAAAWCWLGAFTYGFALSVISGSMVSGAYTFANFVLPLGVGLWIATEEIDTETAFKRVSNCVLAVAVVSSFYGIVQFVFAPPWDQFWLEHAKIDSAGLPLPFQIRVWATLNGPGAFGTFMVAALLLFVPRLSVKKPAGLAAVAMCIVAFALSLARSAWLGLGLGFVAYLVLTPYKVRTLAIAGALVTMTLLAVTVLPAVTGDAAVGTQLGDRFSTLGDLDHDQSANDRRQLYSTGANMLASAPLGLGLGVVGTATKVGSAGSTTNFDSGVLARAVELGIPGGLLFIMGLGFALWTSLEAWNANVGRPEIISIATISIAFQISMIAMELGGDTHLGLPAMLMWALIGITARSIVTKRSRAAVSRLTVV